MVLPVNTFPKHQGEKTTAPTELRSCFPHLQLVLTTHGPHEGGEVVRRPIRGGHFCRRQGLLNRELFLLTHSPSIVQQEKQQGRGRENIDAGTTQEWTAQDRVVVMLLLSTASPRPLPTVSFSAVATARKDLSSSPAED